MENSAFRFDDVRIAPARQIGMHSHSCWELSYVESGCGSRTIGDITERFVSGEIILVPPNIPHKWRFDADAVDSAGNIANISVFFDTSLIASMRSLFPEIAALLAGLEALRQAVSYSGETCQVIRGLLTSMRAMTPEKRLPKMIELLMALSDTSDTVCAGRGSTLSRAGRRLEKVRVYCACNYDRPITLEEMSRYVGMNKSAFCTFMRRHAGMTLSAYVNDMRLERALDRLLHTDSGIAEIAMACGFQSVTYFNRIFRRKYGQPPSSLRR